MSRFELYQPAEWTGYCLEAPLHWKVMKLKRMFSVSSGDFISPDDETDEGIPIFGGNGIRSFTTKSNCRGRTLLIGRVGAQCGNVHLVDGNFWYSEHALRVFPLTPFSLEYFKYLIQVIDLNQFANRTAQPLINSRTTTDRYAAIPPLNEQERIAAYLDASCAAIDTAVAAKRRQLEILDALRNAILHAAFANDNWPVERIKDVATKIGSGVTPEGGASGYLDEGIPLLRSQNVHFDGLRLNDVAYISEDTHADMAGSQLKPRDVLLNITGASIGRCTFVPENFKKGNVNQHVCIIRINHQVDYRFLAAFLSSPMGQGQILSSFTGASRQGLSHKELGFIRIPLPTLEVQRKTVSMIEEQDLKQSRVRNNIENQIETLLAYRKSLIHECVTGQRRVTETDVARVHNGRYGV